jgi:hypothetical protein
LTLNYRLYTAFCIERERERGGERGERERGERERGEREGEREKGLN